MNDVPGQKQPAASHRSRGDACHASSPEGALLARPTARTGQIHHTMKKVRRLLPLLLLLVIFPGCMTYYQRQQEFHGHFRQGRLEEAARVLENDRRGERRRTRLLHLMNQGVVNHMMGHYRESNEFFEEAYRVGQDFRRTAGDQALTLLVNPNVTEYRGEPFELLMIHYYKAMNFLHLGDFDAALVECRRLNIALNELSDRFRSENRYRRDAFVHNLMGIIYDASGDYNNAFIAYRNALEIYEDDYQRLFGIGPPEQLKHDLLRAAHRTGFRDQVRHFEERFGMRFEESRTLDEGELVFFWQNGLGPVKDEFSINFTIVRGSGGAVHFVNEEHGLSFPVPVSQKASDDLGDLRVIRVAFPKYVERELVYQNARLHAGGQTRELNLAQDLNAVAFQALNDRMLQEMGTALLRLAIRQAAEQRIRKEDETVGAIFGILGAVAERADTRNWQTLPHSIYYGRMALPPGQHRLELELILPNGHTARSLNLETEIRSRRTTFKNFHTVTSRR